MGILGWMDKPLTKRSMKSVDPYGTQELRRIQTFIYLIPVLGFFPALWALYQRQGSREQLAICRMAVVLATGWLLGYMLLNAGTQAVDSSALPLLILSSLLTSGYFFVNIWMMVRLWHRKSVRLPGISSLGDRLP